MLEITTSTVMFKIKMDKRLITIKMSTLYKIIHSYNKEKTSL